MFLFAISGVAISLMIGCCCVCASRCARKPEAAAAAKDRLRTVRTGQRRSDEVPIVQEEEQERPIYSDNRKQ